MNVSASCKLLLRTNDIIPVPPLICLLKIPACGWFVSPGKDKFEIDGWTCKDFAIFKALDICSFILIGKVLMLLLTRKQSNGAGTTPNA